jgi:DNA-binding NarL/FixJ family response regulator
MTRTRIFIIHENPARLRQAATLLNAHRHLRVLHLMSSVHECFARLGVANCDFILVSATLPNEEVRKLLKYLRQQVMPTKVIVTDVPNDPQQILTYIAAGAVGYVLVQEGVGAWAKQIEAVCSGQPLVSPAMAAAMMEHLARLSQLTTGFAPQSRLYANLTRREHEVLRLLGEGHPNRVIANQLTITVGTVKNHVHCILTKLKLSHRKAAGMYLAFGK